MCAIFAETVLPSKNAAAATGSEALLLRNQFLHCRARGLALELSSLVVKPLERASSSARPNFAFWTADFST
jgi:hypothetical protein